MNEFFITSAGIFFQSSKLLSSSWLISAVVLLWFVSLSLFSTLSYFMLQFFFYMDLEWFTHTFISLLFFPFFIVIIKRIYQRSKNGNHFYFNWQISIGQVNGMIVTITIDPLGTERTRYLLIQLWWTSWWRHSRLIWLPNLAHLSLLLSTKFDPCEESW